MVGRQGVRVVGSLLGFTRVGRPRGDPGLLQMAAPFSGSRSCSRQPENVLPKARIDQDNPAVLAASVDVTAYDRAQDVLTGKPRQPLADLEIDADDRHPVIGQLGDRVGFKIDFGKPDHVASLGVGFMFFTRILVTSPDSFVHH